MSSFANMNRKLTESRRQEIQIARAPNAATQKTPSAAPIANIRMMPQ